MARTLSTRPRPSRARVVPVAFLRSECETLARTVRHLQLARDEEIAPYRPGGAENPATDAYGWLTYYRRLQRLHARIEARGASGAAPAASEAAADDALVLAALREEPIAVPLVTPPSEGPALLVVRPLSEHALRHLDARDDLLTCLARHAQALAGSERPDDLALRMQILDEVSYQRAVCVWICTSETAPRLPFEPAVTPRPEVPALYLALHAVDSLRIQAAHHRLHALAIQTLRRVVDLDGEGELASGTWRTFFSGLARDALWTVSAQQLMRDRALVGLLVARAVSADAEAKAYAAAKAKAAAEAEQERAGRVR